MLVTLELFPGKAGDSQIFFFLCSVTGSALSEYSWKTFATMEVACSVGTWEQFKQLIPYFTILIIHKVFSDMPLHSLSPVRALAFWKKCFISVRVVRAQHTLTLFAMFQHLTQVILVFDTVFDVYGHDFNGPSCFWHCDKWTYEPNFSNYYIF